jgi:uroporphyrinogen decarboxylase
MTHRERALAVLRYRPYDRLPLVHFGFWKETLQKWAQEGHVTAAEASGWGDGNPVDAAISRKLGFDGNWACHFHPDTHLFPAFESKVVKELPDGSRHLLNAEGVIVLQTPGTVSIPAEIQHTLVDRRTWEEHYQWRLQWSEDRVKKASVRVNDRVLPLMEGGLEFLRKGERDYLYGVHCGSLYGRIRNILGVEGACYLLADDEELLDEIIGTYADLCYRATEWILAQGAKFDTAHFWEDICFKSGPLISPSVFREKVGPHYRRITGLLKKHGIDIVSLDSDGKIDALVPIWFENGVNTMFPIEVGTWAASLAPWRETHGKGLLGVGGMNKVAFTRDRAAVDAEVERMKPLVELGGFIPCPDHRISPDAEWDLVRYYCERMRATFG